MHFLKSKNKLSNKTDIELLAHYSNFKDQEYLAELYNRYSHLVLLVCVKYLKDMEAAKDAVMDIYENLVKSISKNKIENFKNWIYSVTKNHCLMIKRKNSSKIEETNISNINFMEYDTFLHQEDDNEFTAELIREKIKILKKNQRECIERFYFNKQSYKEIAEIISETENSVKSYLQNGKRNLRRLMLEAVKESEF
ncbi:MAG TPA: sigma-70 family RNA polymerase sigma factor [Ignavibacteria bacterium]|nr:sigma-70 family RNA polymerase sigma factor [Ignavibacteria bacterium]